MYKESKATWGKSYNNDNIASLEQDCYYSKRTYSRNINSKFKQIIRSNKKFFTTYALEATNINTYKLGLQ